MQTIEQTKRKWNFLSQFRNDRFRDYGLFLLRVGIGLMFVTVYGYSKIKGGIPLWTMLGGTFNRLIGVSFIPTFWGFMATISEFGGGICLIAGVFLRPACALMLFTIGFVVAAQFRGRYGFSGAALPFTYGSIFASLFLNGSNKFTLSGLFFSKTGALTNE